ncbi:Response regulator receiver domain-containing protein [Prosthecobacter debontii]|uniref:Response regulator receiver domain-containing protein n=1 Tax=Prosthecobacter debontii TaxID=48467 RepID=A0A1T4XJH5_9BACT|nr:response regulator [Prosthecobacter debontii]SKA89690.1 Response regulator receiver domain-containing protein [Prosthecobacter debontii]
MSYPAPSSRSHGRILVVDDEPQMLAVAKAILNAHGMEVEVSDTGSQALQMVAHSIQTHNRFATVVLDLTMPGDISGFETLDGLKKIDAELPVIACSGFFQEDARDLCMAIGFTDVLQKPYTLEHLVATVRRGIARDRAAHDTLA